MRRRDAFAVEGSHKRDEENLLDQDHTPALALANHITASRLGQSRETDQVRAASQAAAAPNPSSTINGPPRDRDL
ncbi:hypothetical protein D4764_22G0004400 [Takifugu flavidus]|uniref:Uncharacterized protein n=1 Tax=Takifugu flavidus TaxID=433684 RepID=A0A5C6NCC8_9TELE|nr:hypothetical protein D4764_22G0004400 [Takifugu flavidus]